MNWKQIGMIIFLVLLVIGFAVPGFLNSDETNLPSEIRYCQADADCYLMCDDLPLAVLCSQNLCQKNSCPEQAYYTLNQTSINFKLEVSLNNQTLDLSQRSNPNNFFVKAQKQNLQVFSSGLSLKYILEKFNLSQNNFILYANGNQSYAYENYVPEEGDNLKIVYS